MDAQKLAKVLAMAASDNEHEALHALRTAKRMLDGCGVDFVEVANRVAGAQPAVAGTTQAHVEDLEDAIFDLRNQIRHLRGENERLRQGRVTAPAEPPGLAEAAKEAAAAIRLRSELASLRDETETMRLELLASRTHAAAITEEAGRLAARVAELEARCLRQEAETRMAQSRDHHPPRPTKRPKLQSQSQYPLL